MPLEGMSSSMSLAPASPLISLRPLAAILFMTCKNVNSYTVSNSININRAASETV